MLVSLFSHIVAAAKTILADDSSIECASILADKLLEKFLWATIPCINFERIQTNDSVYLYATDLLTVGLIWHSFHDAIREGNDDRVLTYWKFFLLTFKATNCQNYSKEAVILLLQVQRLSPRPVTPSLIKKIFDTRVVKKTNYCPVCLNYTCIV